MRINKVIKYLILFDFATLTGAGLIIPIFAIFITSNIIGGTAAVAGFASTIFMASFSIARLSSAYIVDKRLSDKKKVAFSIFGTVLIGISYILYVLARLPWHVYLLQTMNGIGTGFRYAPFMSLFTRHIDKGQESFEWGMAAVSTSIGQALTGAIGGVLVELYGFNLVFTLAGAFIVLSSFIPLTIYGSINSRPVR